tara:strand:+ start:318 stop:1163 length:846 start_codon:yes stop_codon:yes gene_type:complete
MSFTASPAKQKVRDIITKDVKKMKESLDHVNFVTLTDKDITHEKAISNLGVDRILCINKSKDVIDWLESANSLPRIKSIKADINEWVMMIPKHINTFIWFDFCGLATSWDKFFDSINNSTFCKDSKIAVTFCANVRGRNQWLNKFKSKLSAKQLDKLNSTDKFSTKMLAQVLMNVARGKLRSANFSCTEAVAYTQKGSTMFTLVFAHKSKVGGAFKRYLTYIDNTTPLKLPDTKDKENAIKIYRYAQNELGLKAKDLTHIAKNYLNGYGKLAHLSRSKTPS